MDVTAQQSRAVAVAPGAGETRWIGPAFGVTGKLVGAEAGGISIVEHPFGPRAMVPPHRHTREDEISYVIEGELGFRSEDREVTLGAGGYIVKPRNELHAMWNPTDAPARMLEIITPAGFERYFVDLADLAASGGLNPESIARLGARYGLTFDGAWIPDLVARYGVKPPRS
jgi:quercetin dioxygenase-like cupin family protein